MFLSQEQIMVLEKQQYIQQTYDSSHRQSAAARSVLNPKILLKLSRWFGGVLLKNGEIPYIT